MTGVRYDGETWLAWRQRMADAAKSTNAAGLFTDKEVIVLAHATAALDHRNFLPSERQELMFKLGLLTGTASTARPLTTADAEHLLGDGDLDEGT